MSPWPCVQNGISVFIWICLVLFIYIFISFLSEDAFLSPISKHRSLSNKKQNCLSFKLQLQLFLCDESKVLILCEKNLWPLWKCIFGRMGFFLSYFSFHFVSNSLTIHERKSFERLLRRAACNEHCRFSQVCVGKGPTFSLLTKPVVPILTWRVSLHWVSLPGLPVTLRAVLMKDTEVCACLPRSPFLLIPGPQGGYFYTFVWLTECGISPLWSIFIVRWITLPQMHELHILTL